MRPLSLVPIVLLAGCLEPRVSDEVAEDDLILPAGSPVPSLDADPVLGPRIAAATAAGTVPLLSGFAAGKPVRWYDLGPAPDHAAPLYVLVRKDQSGALAPFGHPTILNRIPGDDGYSPFWSVIFVEVSPTYAGELITSIHAMQQARERGLLGMPARKGVSVDCPIVGPGVFLEAPGGGAPIAPAGRFYYEGREGRYFELGVSKLASDGVHVPSADLYVLRREGGEPLSEPVRGVDMTGDGDLRDSNDVFAVPAGDGFTPLARVVDVTVVAGTKSIDSSKDQDVADLRDRADLFATGGAPVTRNVVAFTATTTFINAPIAVEATP